MNHPLPTEAHTSQWSGGSFASRTPTSYCIIIVCSTGCCRDYDMHMWTILEFPKCFGIVAKCVVLFAVNSKRDISSILHRTPQEQRKCMCHRFGSNFTFGHFGLEFDAVCLIFTWICQWKLTKSCIAKYHSFNQHHLENFEYIWTSTHCQMGWARAQGRRGHVTLCVSGDSTAQNNISCISYHNTVIRRKTLTYRYTHTHTHIGTLRHDAQQTLTQLQQLNGLNTFN